MKRFLPQLGLAALIATPLLGAGSLTTLAAPVPSAQVSITDAGYNPQSVNITLGGSVTWINTGSNVHTAVTNGNAPLPFDTQGLAPGQQSTLAFGTPGTYHYTSATDCMNGNSSPTWNCTTDYTVIVGSTPAPSNAPAAPAAPAPAVVPPPAVPAGVPASQVQQNGQVSINDSGESPKVVNITVGGGVSFTNNGNNVHSATSTGGGNPLPFDTGGLSAGQSTFIAFGTVGTYMYNSAPDCQNGNVTAGFNCTPNTINVVNTPAGAVAPPAAAPNAPSAVVTPVTKPVNNQVTLTEGGGFQPQTLTIHVGDTVTWVNMGANVHTVVSSQGVSPGFDSGGLNNGQKFSFQFTKAGTYGYASNTEPVYNTDPNTGQVTSVTYQYTGTVIVQ